MDKVSGSDIWDVKSQEIGAADVVFALDPETSSWAKEGFTHDSNWYAYYILGFTAQQAAEMRWQENEFVPFIRWRFDNFLRSSKGHDFKWETFPAQYFKDLSYLFENSWLDPQNSWLNPPIGSWDVSNVVNIESMFADNHEFNQPLNGWDVGNVTNMMNVFNNATVFNQPLNLWNTSKVANMDSVFAYAESFNQRINEWDVKNVTDMKEMFFQAKSFDQNLGDWNISNVKDMNGIFTSSGMSAENLSLTFQGWAKLAKTKGVHPEINLGILPQSAGQMGTNGEAALQYLVEEHGWAFYAAT
jgi:surface protein